MKSMSKKLLQQQEIEMYNLLIQTMRQMMIPLSFILLALALFYYDESLLGYTVQHNQSIPQIDFKTFEENVRPTIKIKSNRISLPKSEQFTRVTNDKKDTTTHNNPFIRYVP